MATVYSHRASTRTDRLKHLDMTAGLQYVHCTIRLLMRVRGGGGGGGVWVAQEPAKNLPFPLWADLLAMVMLLRPTDREESVDLVICEDPILSVEL